MVFKNSTLRKFANIGQNEQGGVIVINFETAQIHFLGEVLVAVAVAAA